MGGVVLVEPPERPRWRIPTRAVRLAVAGVFAAIVAVVLVRRPRPETQGGVGEEGTTVSDGVESATSAGRPAPPPATVASVPAPAAPAPTPAAPTSERRRERPAAEAVERRAEPPARSAAAPPARDGRRRLTYETTTWVRVRSGPDQDSSVVTTLRPGTRVEVTEVKKGWLTIRWEGAPGWVGAKLLTRVPE